MIKKLLFITLIFLYQNITSQNIDNFYLIDTSDFHQLKNYERELLANYLSEISQIKNDTEKIVKIHEMYEQMNDNDVWVKYLFLMKKYLKNTYAIDSTFYYKYLFIFNTDFAYYHDYSGNIDSALFYYQKSLSVSYKLHDTLLTINALKNIGAMYRYIGDYNSAIQTFEEALDYTKKIRDIESQGFILLNLGKLNMNLKETKTGLKYLYQSLNIRKKIGNNKEVAISLNDIATELCNIEDSVGKGLRFFNEAIKISQSLNDTRNTSTILNNLGAYYNKVGNYDSALYYQEKAATLAKSINFIDGYITMMSNIGKIYLIKGDIQNAKKYGDIAFNLAGNQDKINLKLGPSLLLYHVYKKLGKSDKALEMYELYISVNDSINTEQNQKATIRQQAKFEYEKKEAIAKANFEKDIAIVEAEKNKQRIIIWSFVVGFIIIFVFAMIIFKMFIQKKKANKLLEKQNIEINQKNEEITAQRDEIEAQRDEISKHRDIVVAQKDEIESSINYAQRIQKAVLPSDELLNMFLSDYFVLFRPKDIVSGDFYWATLIKNWQIVTVADCTGHGVPGAFMSMLGISFLNEIVRKKEVTKANRVLNELRKSIIDALKQTGESGTQKDGMDISLIAINTTPQAQTSEGFDPSEVLRAYNAQWAGANNPLWVIRNVIASEAKQSAEPEGDCFVVPPRNDGFIETKPDKMPIAIYERMDDFTNHELQLFSGDTIYMMSDGYEDQFGGPKHKKFLSKNLKQLLIENYRLSMKEQKEILEKTLINWIGNGEQIDDITVLGIKL